MMNTMMLMQLGLSLMSGKTNRPGLGGFLDVAATAGNQILPIAMQNLANKTKQEKEIALAAYQIYRDEVTAKNATGEIFDINIETMLVEAAMAELNERELFSGKENDLVLAISIVQYKKGDAFKRWLMPGMGKTVLSVEANLSNEAGKTLAQSQATKSVGAGGGYTIGAWKRVFEDVSEALIADLMSVR